MDFSNSELKTIGYTQQKLRSHQRGILTIQEVVCAVIHELAINGAARITPHCLTLFPIAARPFIEGCVDLLTSSDYREKLILHVGDSPSEDDRERLRLNYREVCESIIQHDWRSFHEHAATEYAVPEVDLFWEILRGLRSEPEPGCSAEEGCDRPRICVSVFCAAHHYEKIVGKPAPNY